MNRFSNIIIQLFSQYRLDTLPAIVELNINCGEWMPHFKDRANTIWNVADLLQGDYKQSDYGIVILPMTVLRRLDYVLAPNKQKVLNYLPKVEKLSDNAKDLTLNKIAKANSIIEASLILQSLLLILTILLLICVIISMAILHLPGKFLNILISTIR